MNPITPDPTILKLDCLRLAATLTAVSNASEAITAANRMFEFLNGAPSPAPVKKAESIVVSDDEAGIQDAPSEAANRRKVKRTSETVKEEPAPAPAAVAPSGLFSKVREVSLSLRDEKGPDAVSGLLANFKVKRITELKPEQHAEFIQAVEDELMI